MIHGKTKNKAVASPAKRCRSGYTSQAKIPTIAQKGAPATPNIVPIQLSVFNGVVSVKTVRQDNQNGIENTPKSVVAVAHMNQFRGVGTPLVTESPNELIGSMKKLNPPGYRNKMIVEEIMTY